MIKSTKRCLRKVVGRARLYYDELLTAITEIEGIVNSRPLTFLSAEDMDEPLTPSHFLCGRRILTLPHGLTEDTVSDQEEFTLSRSDLTRRLRYLDATLNQFWARWRNEYLLELRDAHRYYKGRSDAVPPSVGDVVLVEEEDKPRALWKLAKVTGLITGRDGYTRGAILHVPTSGGNGVLQRPLQRLYPLEITVQATRQENTEDSTMTTQVTRQANTECTDKVSEPRSLRPRRSAAVEARDKIAACTLTDNDP